MSKILSIKTIRERNYHTLDLGERFDKLLGKPEARFVCMLYGKSGSGKSVFAMQLANEFAQRYGKVLYNSHEEGVNQTIKDRLEKWRIDSHNLYFGNKLTFEEMMGKIKANYYRMVVIDSAQYMEFTVDQLKELRSTFAKRHISIVIVSFGSAWGNTRNANDLLYASDIKAYFDNGALTVQSRYLGDVSTHVLFSTRAKSAQKTLEL